VRVKYYVAGITCFIDSFIRGGLSFFRDLDGPGRIKPAKPGEPEADL